MRYDTDDLKARVEQRKKKFKSTVILSLLIIFMAIFLLFSYNDITLEFICLISIILTIIYIFRCFKKVSPRILFSKEQRGINVKEDEYVTGATRITRYGGYRYRYSKSRHKGDIYIKLDSGEIVLFTCLPKSHLDIFEIGDTLVKYEGCAFPIVEGGKKLLSPCPLCGEVNDSSRYCCTRCGLKIIND